MDQAKIEQWIEKNKGEIRKDLTMDQWEAVKKWLKRAALESLKKENQCT